MTSLDFVDRLGRPHIYFSRGNVETGHLRPPFSCSGLGGLWESTEGFGVQQSQSYRRLSTSSPRRHYPHLFGLLFSRVPMLHRNLFVLFL
jgi:hypothetical protein